MARKTITPKQKKFVEEYVKTGNGALAVRRSYNIGGKGGKSLFTAGSIATENLQKPDVRAYLKSIAGEMADIVHSLARSGETDTVRLNAAKDVLDRAGYKPVDAIDITSNGDVIKAIEYIVPASASNGGSTKP
jgi:phage terminase small subunit